MILYLITLHTLTAKIVRKPVAAQQHYSVLQSQFLVYIYIKYLTFYLKFIKTDHKQRW